MMDSTRTHGPDRNRRIWVVWGNTNVTFEPTGSRRTMDRTGYIVGLVGHDTWCHLATNGVLNRCIYNLYKLLPSNVIIN